MVHKLTEAEFEMFERIPRAFEVINRALYLVYFTDIDRVYASTFILDSILSGLNTQDRENVNERMIIWRTMWHLFGDGIYTKHLVEAMSAICGGVYSEDELTKFYGGRIPSYLCSECKSPVNPEFYDMSQDSVFYWLYQVLSLEDMCKSCKSKRERKEWYSNYLKSDHWQTVRKAALKRAGYRCQICNNKKPLHVHHRTYERVGKELPTDVIALCEDCHETFHEKMSVAPERAR